MLRAGMEQYSLQAHSGIHVGQWRVPQDDDYIPKRDKSPSAKIVLCM